MARRQSVKDIIQEAAREGARETVRLQRRQRNLNLYRATERMLRNYKTYQRLVNDLDGYGFEPVEKSHSVSAAPRRGSGVVDKSDLYDEYVAARKASWARTKARYVKLKGGKSSAKGASDRRKDSREMRNVRAQFHRRGRAQP